MRSISILPGRTMADLITFVQLTFMPVERVAQNGPPNSPSRLAPLNCSV